MADGLARGELPAALDARERAMLAYAERLTLQPAAMVEDDVQRLRAVGFSDPAIGDIALIVALYAMMNRIVDGLSDSLPPELEAEAASLGITRGSTARAAG